MPRVDASAPEQTTGHTRSLGYLPALDGIRGLAVAGVLLFHGGVITGGFLGVDAFFVLSGFLITSLLLNEARGSGTVALGAFWARRARRLLPALFMVLFAVAVFASLVASRDELAQIRDDALATLGYAANWHSIIVGHGYWDLFQNPSPLAHTWSLAIEEQFYLVWPLIMLFVARRAARRSDASRHLAVRVLVVTLGLAATSAALMMLLYNPNRDTARVYFGTDTRAASILFGAALAAWFALRGPARTRAGRGMVELAGIAGAGLLAWTWLTIDGQDSTLYRGGFLWCGLGATAVIAAAVHPRTGPLARALSVLPLRKLGIISYGVYLWHWPIFLVLTKGRTELDDAPLFLVRIAATLAVSTLSYVLVERPIRFGWPSARVARVVSPGFAAVCIAAIVLSTQGAVPAFDLSAGTARASVIPSADAATSLPSEPRVLVVGDSVAYFLGQTIAAEQASLQITAANGAVGGCVFGDGPTQVRDLTGSTMGFSAPTACEPGWFDAARTFRPNHVLLLHGARSTFADIELGGVWASPCQPAFDRWYEQQLNKAVRHFEAQGAYVWLVTLPQDVATWTPANSHERAACENAIARSVARRHDSAAIIDLDAFVCPSGACTMLYGGRRLRPDGVHFEGIGAQYVAGWLAAQVRAGPPPPTT